MSDRPKGVGFYGRPRHIFLPTKRTQTLHIHTKEFVTDTSWDVLQRLDEMAANAATMSIIGAH